MKFTIESKYDVGDRLLTCSDRKATALKIKLRVINNNYFRFEYLIENDNEERIWLAEERLRRVDNEFISHPQTE